MESILYCLCDPLLMVVYSLNLPNWIDNSIKRIYSYHVERSIPMDEMLLWETTDIPESRKRVHSKDRDINSCLNMILHFTFLAKLFPQLCSWSWNEWQKVKILWTTALLISQTAYLLQYLWILQTGCESILTDNYWETVKNWVLLCISEKSCSESTLP